VDITGSQQRSIDRFVSFNHMGMASFVQIRHCGRKKDKNEVANGPD
jgi:hypothetical protein